MITIADKNIRRDPQGNLWIVEPLVTRPGLVRLRFLAGPCVCEPVLPGYKQWPSVEPTAPQGLCST